MDGRLLLLLGAFKGEVAVPRLWLGAVSTDTDTALLQFLLEEHPE